MKSKLMGIIIGIMLITTFVVVAKPSETVTTNTSLPEPTPASYFVDVPVYKVGDQWVYKVDNISLEYSQGTQSMQLFLSIPQLPLEVTDTLGEYYTLTYGTKVNGTININSNRGSGPVNISITFKSAEITGAISVKKTDLSLKDISLSLVKQRCTFNIIQQPFLPLPNFLKKIPTKLTLNLQTNCTPPIALLSFPLNTETFWNLSATNFSLNGKIQNFWFNVLNFINKVAKLLGIDLFPPEIGGLLPKIDIKAALTTFIGGNVFQIPAFPAAFVCLNMENITVPAGTYNAYNVTIAGGAGQYYYAPAAGKIIKLTGNFADVIPYLHYVNLELLSTNYS
jgi:hypothetical protein